MMTSFIRKEFGLSVGQNQVANALATVCPRNRQQKRKGTFPVPYRADCFGHKMNFDQNEKLVMYGVTHVIAIDGHSRFITIYTMPVKNNVVVYEEVFRYVSRMNKLCRICS